MGAEALCTVTVGRRRASGKALLESSEIIFRPSDDSGLRLRIPFAELTTIAADDGRLTVAWKGQRAAFHLGANAAKWAEKIRNPKSVIDKLGIKPGHRVSVLGVRDSAFLAGLRARAATVSNGRPAKDSDAIFLGADSLAGLARIPTLVPYLKRDGAIWTVTPKGKAGIKDTEIMALASRAGLVAVKVVAFSPTHSANKFVIPKSAR